MFMIALGPSIHFGGGKAGGQRGGNERGFGERMGFFCSRGRRKRAEGRKTKDRRDGGSRREDRAEKKEAERNWT